MRLVLLAALVVHVWAALRLARLSRQARPVSYDKQESLVFSYASRTMFWGGIIVGIFVVYHLLHFTWGTVHPDFRYGAVYYNLIVGFQVPLVSAFYILAMIPLGLHMYHGLWSSLQTLGANSPQYNRYRRPFAAAVALAVAVGNASIPVAVLTGILS
jgi:succinate dehydrogenase / fumarate reductase, cytochrome b subunit